LDPQVPEDELSKIRGDRRAVATVVEGDEDEEDYEVDEDEHEVRPL